MGLFNPEYCYRGVITSIYDGDTVRAHIDLGLGVWSHNVKLRLARINTPEIRGPEREEGLKARDFLIGLLSAQTVIIETTRDKTGKYGRYIAEIWLDGENINDLLVDEGFAEYRDY